MELNKTWRNCTKKIFEGKRTDLSNKPTKLSHLPSITWCGSSVFLFLFGVTDSTLVLIHTMEGRIWVVLSIQIKIPQKYMKQKQMATIGKCLP